MRSISWMALVFATVGAHAAPVLLTCPASLPTAQTAQAPAGWEAVPSNQTHAFSGINLFSGPPRDMASLAPDQQSRKGGKLVSTWRLAGKSDEHWLGCAYAETSAQAAQRLPAGLSRCTATHTGPAAALKASPEVRCE